MVHTGTPGGRRLYGPRTLADAERRRLRLISYDRPGYGGSTPQPGRSTADCASDVRVICAALGIDRLAMWGLSGGGPHVLACAALLPDLVPAVASLASLHGGQDQAVPFSHGQWLAAHIPGVEAWFFEEEGHALRESHIVDVDAWLLDRWP
jgi:hypothetical protein